MGRAKGDAPKVTEPNLRFPVVFCENLRFPAKICGFLWFPAPSKCWNFQEKGRICENLRFSAKICVFGALCHLSSVTLSAPSGIALFVGFAFPEAGGVCNMGPICKQNIDPLTEMEAVAVVWRSSKTPEHCNCNTPNQHKSRSSFKKQKTS